MMGVSGTSPGMCIANCTGVMLCPCMIGGVTGTIAGAHHNEGVCAVFVGVVCGVMILKSLLVIVVGDELGGAGVGVDGGGVILLKRVSGLWRSGIMSSRALFPGLWVAL